MASTGGNKNKSAARRVAKDFAKSRGVTPVKRKAVATQDAALRTVTDEALRPGSDEHEVLTGQYWSGPRVLYETGKLGVAAVSDAIGVVKKGRTRNAPSRAAAQARKMAAEAGRQGELAGRLGMKYGPAAL